MAEQEEPIHRRVALKVIKVGMDTKEVIARFEAERQALALMDHPNIAKVFDAGATESGRPYFVMELVRGTSITEYCDQHQLSTAERCKLFMQVCHAIQHAHQKGIIHRDIKPSNVLLTSSDGVPVPKVIDFGIAKATQLPLTPPFRHQHQPPFGAVEFSPDGGQLVVTSGDTAQSWPLPRDPRPAADLVKLAQLLSGRRIEASGRFAQWQSQGAADDWAVLRAKYPASFRVDPGQIRSWREQITDRAIAERNWFSAAFHLDQLLKEDPNNDSLRRRRARVRNQLTPISPAQLKE